MIVYRLSQVIGLVFYSQEILGKSTKIVLYIGVCNDKNNIVLINLIKITIVSDDIALIVITLP
jgi:hypothetical protein